MSATQPATTFLCGECSLTFRSQNTRNSHFNATGHEAPPFECPAPACKEVREDNGDLWEHMQTCALLTSTKRGGIAPIDLYAYCPTCDELFYDSESDDVRCLLVSRLTYSTCAQGMNATPAMTSSKRWLIWPGTTLSSSWTPSWRASTRVCSRACRTWTAKASSIVLRARTLSPDARSRMQSTVQEISTNAISARSCFQRSKA